MSRLVPAEDATATATATATAGIVVVAVPLLPPRPPPTNRKKNMKNSIYHCKWLRLLGWCGLMRHVQREPPAIHRELCVFSSNYGFCPALLIRISKGSIISGRQAGKMLFGKLKVRRSAENPLSFMHSNQVQCSIQ